MGYRPNKRDACNDFFHSEIESILLKFFIQSLEAFSSPLVPRHSWIPTNFEPGECNILPCEHSSCGVKACKDVDHRVVVTFSCKELLAEFSEFQKSDARSLYTAEIQQERTNRSAQFVNPLTAHFMF